LASEIVPLPRGGRVSKDHPESYGRVPRLRAPSDPQSLWRVEDLDRAALDILTPAELLQLLCDISPECSLGLWNFLRFANPGWEAKVYRAGTKEPDPEGQAIVDAFFARLTSLHGSADVPLNRLFTGDFLRGAKAMELVLDADARTMLDLATPDAFTIRFETRPDPILGEVDVPFQFSGRAPSQRIYLDIPTFKYIPVDPFPGTPYGRPLVTPALFPTLFTISMLHDLKRVIAVQGYPRIHVQIDSEKVASMAESDMTNEEYMDLMDEIVEQVRVTIDELEPDQTYVSSDIVTMNRPIGTLDASTLGMVDGILRALERMTTRAVKSMPILMGIGDATTEVGANRQWEAWSAGIRTLQHGGEQGLGQLLNLGLRAAGRQSECVFRFQELRQSEEVRDAQALQLRLDNAFSAYAFGFVSLDEACLMALNHLPDPAAGDEPRLLPSGFSIPGAPPTQNIPNPDPGAVAERVARARRLGDRFSAMPAAARAPAWFRDFVAELNAQTDAA